MFFLKKICRWFKNRSYGELSNVKEGISYFSLKGVNVYVKITNINSFNNFDLCFKYNNKYTKFKSKLVNVKLKYDNTDLLKSFDNNVKINKIYYAIIHEFNNRGILEITLYNSLYDKDLELLSINDIILVNDQSYIL